MLKPLMLHKVPTMTSFLIVLRIGSPMVGLYVTDVKALVESFSVSLACLVNFVSAIISSKERRMTYVGGIRTINRTYGIHL